MTLAEHVKVSRRFQRAIRIDLDLGNADALEGFTCPQSSAEVLQTMARHVALDGQGAFTWTGPYGSGKSSLAVALSALLNGQPSLRESAASSLGEQTTSAVWQAMPPRAKGWRILPVVGRRDRPAQVVGEALEACGFITKAGPARWTEKQVLGSLKRVADEHPRAGGGLMVLIDEMGKFLESAAHEGSDIYFFQQLAEIASRSNNRLIVVCILHQAFEEYAQRLSREAGDEWAKIQGRFVDLAVNTRSDEQIDLLSRAIESNRPPREPSCEAQKVAELARAYTSTHLAMRLEECWPLHPIVACLLGPISRRRFGQNQRSIFGFLNSSEPMGFQDFLRSADADERYTPDLLWDYLRINLEPSIMASPDAHRWASSVDAVERCEALGGDELCIKVLKTIALVGMFRERSGLAASAELLVVALPAHNAQNVAAAIARLKSWSLIIYRRFDDSYSVFEGSDFDIEYAVNRALESMGGLDFNRLEALAKLRPIVAKRHYHRTGALRWFDVRVVPVAEVDVAVETYVPLDGAIGAFFLAIPTLGESEAECHTRCRRAASVASDWEITVGLPLVQWDVTALVRELLALEQTRSDSPELQGDGVARREIEGRISHLQGYIEGALVKSFDSAHWYQRGRPARALSSKALNGLASELTDDRFRASPILLNELLNRTKPSSNAVAAQNALLRAMVLHETEERLGIAGFPAEAGLYESLLGASRLHRNTPDGWRFTTPEPHDDPCRLFPAWNAATEFLRDNAQRAVSASELYAIWRDAPYGIKDGLLPVLLVAFILSMQSEVVLYRQGIFQPRMTDLDTDYLAKDSAAIELRWMSLSEESRQLLSGLASIVREMHAGQMLVGLEPIDVARGLVSIYDRLPMWVKRTQRLSTNAKRLRELFKKANDPTRFIFDDIPEALSGEGNFTGGDRLQQTMSSLMDGLRELRGAYPAMLHRLREVLLTELDVPNTSEAMLEELQARAENARQLSGDHRLEAFVIRLAGFRGSDEDMESLASLATNKPVAQWVDPDFDRATVELADLAQRFKRLEAYAHVKGRPDRRHAMALVVGKNGGSEPLRGYFDVADHDMEVVAGLVTKMRGVLATSGEQSRDVILAALTELSAEYLNPATGEHAEAGNEQRELAS